MVRLFYMTVPKEQTDKLSERYKSKAMSVLARELVERLVTKETKSPFRLRMEHRESGEPYIEGHEDIRVSLSHSGNIICAAYSDALIGIDVEKKAELREKVLSRAYNAYERRYVEGFSDPEEKRAAFYKVWTVKEAAAKSMGEGLSSVMLMSACDEKGIIGSFVCKDGSKVYIKSLLMPDGSAVSVACEDGRIPEFIEIPEEACRLLTEAVL